MRSLSHVALVLAALAVAPGAGAQARLLIPLYTYPGVEDPGAYRRVAEASATVPISVVVNPCDGPIDPAAPGPCSLDDYTQHLRTVDTLRTGAPSLRVLGYVPTGYAVGEGAQADAVRAAVDTYAAEYTGAQALDGLFFDEASSGEGSALLYRALCRYAKNAGFGEVVLNPGTAFHPDLLAGGDCDAAVALEDALGGSEGWDTYEVPAPIRGLRPDQLGVLIYGAAGRAAMERVVGQALDRGFGLLYVTDDTEAPNPWNQLATYLEAEAERVVTVSTSAAPPPEPSPTLAVAPNPTAGPVTLTGLPAGPVRLEVIDALGRSVAEATRSVADGRPLALDLADLPAGTYLVVVTAGGRRQSVRVTVAR